MDMTDAAPNEFERLRRFVPELFDAMSSWLLEKTNGSDPHFQRPRQATWLNFINAPFFGGRVRSDESDRTRRPIRERNQRADCVKDPLKAVIVTGLEFIDPL